MLFLRRRDSQTLLALKNALQAAESKDKGAEQFLLVEYELMKDLRNRIQTSRENRIRFAVGLQTAEIAFIGLLISSKAASLEAILVIGLVLGLPTLIFTYMVHVRIIRFHIDNTRYIRATNAIRGYFVNRYPEIRSAISLPTDPNVPPVRPLALTVTQGMTFLILTAILSAFLTTAASWLAINTVLDWSATTSLLVSIIVGALAGLGIAVLEFILVKRRLEQAERALRIERGR